ncbi:MAG TPA: hypothetical protein VL025_22565 [Thermoanaerobaculia bacterium]|nr:hypothetical protein [Thermoanaerobaculia bacterium]
MPKLLVTHADIFTEAERMFGALDANVADLAHLQGSREKLGSQLELAREVFRLQSAHTAGKQEASQQLKQIMLDLGKLVSFLRHGVKEHYGTRSEKLVDFGLTPYRSQPRRVETAPPAPPAPPAPATE